MRGELKRQSPEPAPAATRAAGDEESEVYCELVEFWRKSKAKDRRGMFTKAEVTIIRAMTANFSTSRFYEVQEALDTAEVWNPSEVLAKVREMETRLAVGPAAEDSGENVKCPQEQSALGENSGEGGVAQYYVQYVHPQDLTPLNPGYWLHPGTPLHLWVEIRGFMTTETGRKTIGFATKNPSGRRVISTQGALVPIQAFVGQGADFPGKDQFDCFFKTFADSDKNALLGRSCSTYDSDVYPLTANLHVWSLFFRKVVKKTLKNKERVRCILHVTHMFCSSYIYTRSSHLLIILTHIPRFGNRFCSMLFMTQMPENGNRRSWQRRAEFLRVA